MSDNREIAATIYSQLGGDRFKMMTGAKSFGQVEKGLSFRLPKGKHFTIILKNDLYSMSYWKNARFNGDKYIESKCLDRREDIFCDALQETFTAMTGLYTSLRG